MNDGRDNVEEGLEADFGEDLGGLSLEVGAAREGGSGEEVFDEASADVVTPAGCDISRGGETSRGRRRGGGRKRRGEEGVSKGCEK